MQVGSEHVVGVPRASSGTNTPLPYPTSSSRAARGNDESTDATQRRRSRWTQPSTGRKFQSA